MKNTLPLFFVFLLTIGFPTFAEAQQNVSREIIVAGKVDNYDPVRPFDVSVHRLGFHTDKTAMDIDPQGNFRAVFKSYIPVDVVITYRTNFWVLAQPGDSLYVHFDGAAANRPRLLSTIRFGGDRAGTNRSTARFQQMYFSDPIYWDWDAKDRAVKEYAPGQYLQYLDTVRAKGQAIYDRFVAENAPDEIAKKWASFYLDVDKYVDLATYPMFHRDANGLSWMDSVVLFPQGFTGAMEERISVDPDLLIAASSLNQFASWYITRVEDLMREEHGPAGDRDGDGNNDWAVLPTGGMMIVGESDSLMIYNIVKHVPDTLLREIMLTNRFQKSMEKQDISGFEKHRDFLNEHIRQPWLVEPLYEKYLETKFRLEQPELHTGAIVREAASSSAGQMFNEILETNKGRVIYIDFWATWCGPCLSEMPRSKQVEEELHGKDVSFVYICLESDRDKALTTLSRFQLSGEHYILSLQQSREIRDLFGIDGIPFYVLIDKNGTILEQGSHLRPLAAKQKIEGLL